ncbi:FtsX-like permease family protein [uncultured Robinsoniella sp.]|uniref:ABC transporter permease n=1 Tax=uncultured Robinsoniella sp. TaxID=904190 RepID=UPI00374F93A3
MNIILKYIFTNVKERKTRTAVMLLSIVLSTTLLFVSFSIGSSYESAQRKMARGMAGTASITVKSADADSLSRLEDIPNLENIQSIAGILESSALYHENGYFESVDLIAADLEQLNQINKPRLVNGSEISGFTGNKIILPDRFTSKYNIVQGDTVTLEIGGNPYSFEVSDIAAYDTVFLRHTRGVNALLPLETLSELLHKAGGFSQILIEQKEGAATESLIDELSKQLPAGKYRVNTTVNEEQIIAGARQKTMPFFLISFFSLTMSVFIIYSSYKVITLERLPIIGTFRSIGANEKMVKKILMIESILYGCLGGLLGIPIGIAVLNFMLHGLGKSLEQGIAIPTVIAPVGVAVSVSAAIIVSLLSAYIPVKRASRLPIKDVVLGTVEEKNVSNSTVLGIGIVMLLVSVILPRIAPDQLLYIAGGFSLLGLIAAAIMLIPLFTDLASVILELLYEKIWGNEGKLAARNMRKNKNVTQNITLLFISISAVIAISVVGDFVKTYVGDVFRDAELQGFADGEMDQEFIEQVRQMEGIDKVLPLYVMNQEISGNHITFSRMEGTDDIETYSSMLAIRYTDPEMKEQAAEAFREKRAIILNEETIKAMDCGVGDTIKLSNGNEEISYTVAGSFKSRASDVQAVIPSEYAVADFNQTSYGFMAYTAADPDAIMIQVRELFGDTTNWSRTVEEFNHDSLSTIGSFLAPMNYMTYFILLLAAIGIINNLLINYIQKRRSIAMYKSVGQSNRQNMKMTLIEGLTSGILGAVIGIVISTIEIQTIFIVAGPKISMTPDLDFKTFLLAGGLGIAVTLIGCTVPIIKGRNMKIVEEIKFESSF